MPSNPPPEGEPYVPIQYTSDVFPTERADPGYPPTGRARRKKQRSAGRHQRGPQRRRRAELMGFNAALSMALIVALVAVLVLSVLII